MKEFYTVSHIAGLEGRSFEAVRTWMIRHKISPDALAHSKGTRPVKLFAPETVSRIVKAWKVGQGRWRRK